MGLADIIAAGNGYTPNKVSRPPKKAPYPDAIVRQGSAAGGADGNYTTPIGAPAYTTPSGKTVPSPAATKAAAQKVRRIKQHKAALAAYKPHYTSKGRSKSKTAKAIQKAEKAISETEREIRKTVREKPEVVAPKAVKTATPMVSPDRMLREVKEPKAVKDFTQKPKPVEARAPKKVKIQVARKLNRAVKKSGGGVPDFVPGEYRKLVSKASRKNGVPKPILSALLQQESGFDPDISSPAGAQGIAQFMPATAAGRGVDPLDPKSAIPGAAKYLADNKKQFGSWDLALAAYNAGGGAVSEYGGIPPYEETQNYVKSIMGVAKSTPVKPGKKVPQKVITKAEETIGPVRTKKLLHGKPVTFTKGKPDKDGILKGRYAGSKSLVQEIVGSKVRGDHGGTKHGEAPGVHSAEGDHYREDGYAQDINGDNPRENEPAYTQESLDEIVANLRKLGAKDVPDLKIGENWEGTVGGYDVQLLTNEGGTVNHIHIGAHPSGETSPLSNTVTIGPKPVAGTTAAGSVGSAVGTLTASASAAATGKAAKTQKAAQRRRRVRPVLSKQTKSGGYYEIGADDYELDPYIARLISAAS